MTEDWAVRACETGWRANVTGSVTLSTALGWPYWLTVPALMVILMAVTWHARPWRSA